MKYLYLLVALIVVTQVIQVEARFRGRRILRVLGATALAYEAEKVFSKLFGGNSGDGQRHDYRPDYRRDYRPDYRPDYGHDYGRGYGYGGQPGDYRRYRRAVSAVEQREARVEGLQMDAYFTAVQLGDDDGCGLRLVCELHTMDPARLGEEENMILALFGSNVPSSGRPDSPKLAYDAAAELGLHANSTEMCAETYRTCQYGADTLIQALKDSWPTK